MIRTSSSTEAPGTRLELTHHGELRILAIGDTHFPFTDLKKLQEIYRISKDLKPTHIVQMGDLYDMYSFSRFSQSRNLIKPQDEIREGNRLAKDMWKRLNQISPYSKKFQLRGNHSDRIWKKIMEFAPQYESLIKGPIDTLFRYDGVNSFEDSRSELVINGIMFHHGWQSTIGAHARWYGQSTVVGHLHRGGIVFFPMKGVPIYELNCGFIADVNQLPLEYGETKTNSWVPGVGIIDRLGPRFCPL